jgi:cytoskeleton protein RodZ
VALGQDGVEQPAGVGARLRGARERAGLSLVSAAEKLHVDAAVLDALEAEKFEQLGAPVYVRGYLRHYADLVRESPAELEELYGASGHAARMPDLTHIPRAERERFSSTLLLPGIVVVLAVALIGMGWWIAGALSRGAKMRRVAAAAMVRPMAGSPNLDRAAAAQGRAGFMAVRPSQAVGASVSLEMRYSADSWTEVYDAAGKRLLYDLARAGSTRKVEGKPPLRVVLGNASAVSLELDGRPVATPDAASDTLSEFLVSASGRVARVHRRPAGAQGQGAGPKAIPGPETLAGSGAANNENRP